MNPSRYDVIIIGAGPAGSTAAILLAQAGWSVALVEKQRFPRRKVCGECIAATNLALIDQLGIGDAFNQIAGPALRRVALMSGSKTVEAGLPPMREGAHRWGRALGREHLDTLLLERAIQVGANVFQPFIVRSIAGHPGDLTCCMTALNSTQTSALTAPVVIAAHGSWELTPAAPERVPHRPGDLFAFKANFRHSRLPDGLLPVLAFRGGYGGMVVGDHGLTTLACCVRRDVISARRKAFGTHTAAEAIESYVKASCAGVETALSGAEREGAWLSVGPIRPGIRLTRQNPVYLVGNAAGEAHPIIGEGISMAMQSAWLLSQHLIANGAALLKGRRHEVLHDAYVRQWSRHFASRIRLSALFAHLAMRPGLSLGIISLLQRWPDLLTQSARWSGKVRELEILSP